MFTARNYVGLEPLFSRLYVWLLKRVTMIWSRCYLNVARISIQKAKTGSNFFMVLPLKAWYRP